MVEKLIKKIISTSKVAAISMKISSDSAANVSLCILEKKKGIVTIIKATEDVSLEQLPAHIGKDVPVIVVVDGRGVLHKKMDANAETPPDKLLTKIMPQAKPEDFYLQQFKSGDIMYASLIRQQLLQDLIARLSSLKLDVVRIYQGPFVASVVLPFIDLSKHPQLIVGADRLLIADGHISEYLASGAADEKVTYMIGDESISSASVLSYAAALGYVMGQEPQQVVDEVAGLSDLHQEWEQKQIFKKSGRCSTCSDLYDPIGEYIFLYLV